MKLKSPNLKTSLTLVVALLSLLTFVVVGGSWYVQQRSEDTIDQFAVIGVQANSDVKNAYIYALLAVSQVDDAIKIDNEKQRLWELGQVDTLLQRSRERMGAFMGADNLTGGEGESLKHILDTTFKEYWDQAGQLRDFAAVQDVRGYEALKRGRARGAARGIDRAFNKFDEYLAGHSQATDASLSRQFERSRYASIGVLAAAVLLAILAYQILMRTVLQRLRIVSGHFSHIAAGDLSRSIQVLSRDEIGELFEGLRRMQHSLGNLMDAVRGGMQRISHSTGAIAAGNLDLSSRTDQQAAALQETAASMEQLASTVKQNADNAQQANRLASAASEVATRGGAVVDEVVDTMRDISSSSRQIADIVGVIDGIAFQTNILALNAAVEAARAGEQGKGFAVVAAEVRALAQRSAVAAKEIRELIDGSVARVGAGSELVERAGETMREIVESVTRVTDIMNEITAATVEQSAGIDQINLAIVQMDAVTQQNAQLVQVAAEAAAALQHEVEHVTQAVSVFRTASFAGVDAAGSTAALTEPHVGTGRPGTEPPAASPDRTQSTDRAAGRMASSAPSGAAPNAPLAPGRAPSRLSAPAAADAGRAAPGSAQSTATDDRARGSSAPASAAPPAAGSTTTSPSPSPQPDTRPAPRGHTSHEEEWEEF